MSIKGILTTLSTLLLIVSLILISLKLIAYIVKSTPVEFLGIAIISSLLVLFIVHSNRNGEE